MEVTIVSAGEGARPLPPVMLKTAPLTIHARLPPGADPGDITLERAVMISGDADLARETQALTDALYARTPNASAWSGDRLVRALKNARPRVLAARLERMSGADDPLPPLNP